MSRHRRAHALRYLRQARLLILATLDGRLDDAAEFGSACNFRLGWLRRKYPDDWYSMATRLSSLAFKLEGGR